MIGLSGRVKVKQDKIDILKRPEYRGKNIVNKANFGAKDNAWNLKQAPLRHNFAKIRIF